MLNFGNLPRKQCCKNDITVNLVRKSSLNHPERIDCWSLIAIIYPSGVPPTKERFYFSSKQFSLQKMKATKIWKMRTLHKAAFYFELIPFRKIWMYFFSTQIWVRLLGRLRSLTLVRPEKFCNLWRIVVTFFRYQLIQKVQLDLHKPSIL